MKILLNITHGFQARMLLRSSIAETLLAEGAQLVVVSPNAEEPYFQREFSHPQITLEPMPSCFSRAEALAINLRQFLLMNPALGATLNFKNEALRREAPIKFWLARSGNAVLGRFPSLRRLYLEGERVAFPGREFDDLLTRHSPDLVVSGTPGYNRDDIHLLRSSRRLGIKTATVMLSWDNLTAKGYMGAVPDHLLVWSDLMAHEAVSYHEFAPERIAWCGAAQFDHYHQIRRRLDRQAWRRQHGVPEDAVLIVYGTMNYPLLPHEINVLRAVVDAVNGGRFERDVYLWVRLHPQYIRGDYARPLEAFRALSGPRVRIEEPPVQSERLAWDLPKDDAQHLAELLAAADVCATPNSTLVIDAACAETPSVSLFFDGAELVPETYSARRFANYTHYSKILQTGGVAIAWDIDEFIRHVDGYARDPERDRPGREAIIRQQLNALDGRAGWRTAKLLSALARGQPLEKLPVMQPRSPTAWSANLPAAKEGARP